MAVKPTALFGLLLLGLTVMPAPMTGTHTVAVTLTLLVAVAVQLAPLFTVTVKLTPSGPLAPFHVVGLALLLVKVPALAFQAYCVLALVPVAVAAKLTLAKLPTVAGFGVMFTVPGLKHVTVKLAVAVLVHVPPLLMLTVKV